MSSIKKAASQLAIQLPGVVLTDGDAQLARAFQTTFPEALRQRCIFHKAKNMIDYIKKEWLRPALARILQEFRGEVPMDSGPGNDIEETEEENPSRYSPVLGFQGQRRYSTSKPWEDAR